MRERLEMAAIWAVVIACIFFYIANIVSLADMCCHASGMMILRAIGVLFIPLGVILGLF